jgi:hypothetical protein
MLSLNVLLVGLAATGAAAILWQRLRPTFVPVRVRRERMCLRRRRTD